MTDHDQRLANLAEQEHEVEDALTRVGQGMGTAEDEAILRCALGLPARKIPIPASRQDVTERG